MLRVIVRQQNIGAAANVGGPVELRFKTFDIDPPDLDAYLHQKLPEYVSREVVGVEVLPAPK